MTAAINYESIEARAVEVWDLAMSDPIAAAMVVTACVLSILFVLHLVMVRKKDKREDQLHEEQHPASSPRLDQFVEQWEATTDWPTKLQATDRRPWFSAEVEDALVIGSKQPLLIVGMIEDIRREDEGYICEMRPARRLRADVRFELLVPAAQVEGILKGQSSRVGRFAVAATITRVRRQRFEAVVTGDEVGLGSSHLFLATGSVHAMLNLDA